LKNVAFIAGLLVVPFLLAWATGKDLYRAGRFGLALVFAFTALGHFVKTEPMAKMLPSWVPKRGLLIWMAGLFEAALAISLLACSNCFSVGLTIIVFLVAVFPSNIYSALHRVDFGGHAAGPRYLLVRGAPSASVNFLGILVYAKGGP
jgi:uncharacterized membrane protein